MDNQEVLSANQPMFANYSDVVTPDDLMKMLCVGRNTVYQMLQDNVIKSFKVGRHYKIPKTEVIAYLER